MSLDAKRIQKPARKLRKLIASMASAPTPDEIHKFRTNSRRIKTSLDVLSLDSHGTGRRLSKQIAKLGKRAGKIRDMDVLTNLLVSVKYPDSERACHVRLLEHLGAKRENQVKKFEAARKRSQKQLRRALKRVSKKMEKAVSKDTNGNARRKSISAQTTAAALTRISELKEPPRLQRTNLHAYRLKVKEARNLLQMSTDAEQQEFIDKLTDVKDAIGEWHDWDVLTALANETLDHGKSCKLIEDLRRTVEQNYSKALALAQSMRRDFLHLSHQRSRSSKKGSVRLAQPVLSATAALAA